MYKFSINQVILDKYKSPLLGSTFQHSTSIYSLINRNCQHLENVLEEMSSHYHWVQTFLLSVGPHFFLQSIYMSHNSTIFYSRNSLSSVLQTRYIPLKVFKKKFNYNTKKFAMVGIFDHLICSYSIFFLFFYDLHGFPHLFLILVIGSLF